MENSNYGLLIKFTDPSVSFTAGYEAGMLHKDLEDRIPQDRRTVHTVNKETILNMCRHFKRAAVFEEVECEGISYPDYLLFSDKPLMSVVK